MKSKLRVIRATVVMVMTMSLVTVLLVSSDKNKLTKQEMFQHLLWDDITSKSMMVNKLLEYYHDGDIAIPALAMSDNIAYETLIKNAYLTMPENIALRIAAMSDNDAYEYLIERTYHDKLLEKTES